MRVMLAITSLALLVMTATGARTSETYPTRTISLIVPFSAGGPVDSMARLLAAKMSENMGQPIVVENRPGGGGTIGANSVAKATPDGYSILYTPNTLAVSQAIYRKLPFDAQKDLTPISEALSFSFILVTRPDLMVKTLPEFIAMAKAKPGKLNFGTAGPGDVLQLSMEFFKASAGIDVVPIPYKGQAPILGALLGGEIEAAFLSPQIALAPVQSGKLTAIAVTSARRSPAFPDLPTMAEAGVTGFDVTGWQGAFAPAGTPREIVERLNREITRAVNLPDVRKAITASGNEVVGNTSEEFSKTFNANVAGFRKLVQAGHVPYQD